MRSEIEKPTGPVRARLAEPCFEAVEPRVLFSASPIDTPLGEIGSAVYYSSSVSLPSGFVDVGQQPVGELSDKIVYVHGGHGYTADNLGSGSWTTQRGEGFEVVEDLGNHDQMTILVDYLFNAGATVVPLRPVGHQTNEIILDNDDVEVTFTGAWSNSSAGIYFGDAGDVPYRFASTSATETATAEYRPDIDEAGFYPVYAWTRYGSDRAADQLYRVHHTGGATEVTINHRRVGNGPVYLGTYYFDQGTEGYVEISNRSSESGRVVIADMIRFGNGMGDIDRGGGVSGQSREDEAGLYWIQWHVEHSQGISTSEYRVSSADSSATVSATPRYAEYMNRESDGSLSDRLFVSFHSNAGGGRGVVGLHNTANGGATPNQFFLAETLAKEVNDDVVAQNANFEHNWNDRGTNLTYQASFNYGEIHNAYINNEFDATIVETGFHDNQLDAELLRDPKVRDAIARATYQGIVKYFNQVDGGATSVIDLPAPVTDLRTNSDAEGQITVSWAATPANSTTGGLATGYMIYQSADGYGFDGGTYVAGNAADSYTFTGIDPEDGVRYFKVAAVNLAGESLTPDTVAGTAASPELAQVLIVNGFDRLGRSLNPTQPYLTPTSSNTVDRVRPRNSNSFDYAVQHAAAIGAYSNNIGIDTAQNESVADGSIDLADYDAVFWISGEESTADSTFTTTEQNFLITYVAGGGHFFSSGAEIGWDLDLFNNGRTFYNAILRADYVSDDAGTYDVAGATGSIFQGIALDFDTADTVYDAEYPDVIAAVNGSTPALIYVGGSNSGSTAAVQHDGSALGIGNTIAFGFPFETIADRADRDAIMAAALSFFEIPAEVIPALVGDYNGDGIVAQADLDLVLLNWGDTDLPAGFDEAALANGEPFDGLISQNELDGVLLNWGNAAAVSAFATTLESQAPAAAGVSTATDDVEVTHESLPPANALPQPQAQSPVENNTDDDVVIVVKEQPQTSTGTLAQDVVIQSSATIGQSQSQMQAQSQPISNAEPTTKTPTAEPSDPLETPSHSAEQEDARHTLAWRRAVQASAANELWTPRRRAATFIARQQPADEPSKTVTPLAARITWSLPDALRDQRG